MEDTNYIKKCEKSLNKKMLSAERLNVKCIIYLNPKIYNFKDLLIERKINR